jgi:hypothetical protein
MPEFLLLFYADGGPDDAAERWKELPEWRELAAQLRDAGTLLANNALRDASAARTVRARDGEVAVTDGPFATTKETLAGYFLLRCADLDAAVACAARIPTARYGAVEVRPVMTIDDVPAEAR